MARLGNKFHAVKVEEDGHVFDSKKELGRYRELRELEKAGVISGLRVHPRAVLVDAFVCKGSHFRETCYEGDFSYIRDGEETWEDVKSPASRTPVYMLKRKLMALVHGIVVKEVM